MVNVRSPSKIPKQYQPYVARRQQQKVEMRSRLKARHQLGLQRAKELADILKSEFGATKVALFGSMLSASEIHLSSDIDLAVWDLPSRDYFSALSRLFLRAKEFDIDLVRIEEAPDSLRHYVLKQGAVLEAAFPLNQITFDEPLPRMNYGPLIGRIRRMMKDLEAECQYAQQQAKVARETDQSAYWNDAGFNLHGFYTGLEKIFKQIAREVDGGMNQQDSGWHKALLEQMVIENLGTRPAVISEETYQSLNEYLRFRHVVRSHYTHWLDPEKISENVNKLPHCYALVIQELDNFCEFLAAVN